LIFSVIIPPWCSAFGALLALRVGCLKNGDWQWIFDDDFGCLSVGY